MPQLHASFSNECPERHGTLASSNRLTYDYVKLVLWLVHRVKAVHEIHREHAEMFIKELYPPLVDAYCDRVSQSV